MSTPDLQQLFDLVQDTTGQSSGDDERLEEMEKILRAALESAKLEVQPEPQPPSTFPPRIWNLLQNVADRNGTEYLAPWEDDDGPMQDDADLAIAWIRVAQPVGVPAGWKLVPIEPTDAILEAMYHAYRYAVSHMEIEAIMYRAGVEAAPEAQAAIAAQRPSHEK